MTTAQKVSRGIKLLNRMKPGWEKKVSLKKLHMHRCESCILGQVFGEFHAGRAKLHLDFKGTQERGFTISNNTYWSGLESAWKKRLKKLGVK